MDERLKRHLKEFLRQEPEVCERISSNQAGRAVYKVVAGGEWSVVKLLDKGSDSIWAQHLIDCQNLAAQHKVAPAILYSDARDAAWVMEWAKGEQPTSRELCDKSLLTEIARQLQILHQARYSTLDSCQSLGAQIRVELENVSEQVLNKKAKQALLSVLSTLEEHSQETSMGRCLIHGHLGLHHIRRDGAKVKFVGWNDAGLGSPYQDLTAVTCLLSEEYRNHFLECYFDDRVPDDIDTMLKTYHALQAMHLACWSLARVEDLNSFAQDKVDLMHILNEQNPVTLCEFFKTHDFDQAAWHSSDNLVELYHVAMADCLKTAV